MAKKQQTKEHNKLTKLVEQASLTINMAEADDLAEMQNLQNIMGEIEKNIETIAQAPTQLLDSPNSFGYLSVRLEAVLAHISYFELAPKIRIFSNVEGIILIS